MKGSPAKSTKTGVSKKRNRNEAGDAGQSSLSPPSTLSNPAEEWKKANLKTEDLLTLVNSGFFRDKEMDLWRTSSGDQYPMEKNPYEILIFAWFVEHGLMLPASDFFKRMLRYYWIEYLNFNPNDIFHVSIFVISAKCSWGSNPTASCSGSSSG
jgi:hypothetical protein